MDIDVFPNSVKYWGPTGMVLFRNVQFRWMPRMLWRESSFSMATARISATAGAYLIIGSNSRSSATSHSAWADSCVRYETERNELVDALFQQPG
jgi:hypothetical protein